ncbi:hypothetical protein ACJX0J_016195, partial [Zea mays]
EKERSEEKRDRDKGEKVYIHADKEFVGGVFYQIIYYETNQLTIDLFLVNLVLVYFKQPTPNTIATKSLVAKGVLVLFIFICQKYPLTGFDKLEVRSVYTYNKMAMFILIQTGSKTNY